MCNCHCSTRSSGFFLLSLSLLDSSFSSFSCLLVCCYVWNLYNPIPLDPIQVDLNYKNGEVLSTYGDILCACWNWISGLIVCSASLDLLQFLHVNSYKACWRELLFQSGTGKLAASFIIQLFGHKGSGAVQSWKLLVGVLCRIWW